MEQTVYFADKSVTFTRPTPCGACRLVAFNGDGDVSRAKILKILETENSVVVTAADPARAFAAFAAGFTPVEAAGGVVVNERGEWLMILRNGRWDLPKGHVEPGEAWAECAVREVAEETGVGSAQIVRPLCDTLHAYCMHGRWELKRTHWYAMRITACEDLAPQTEEGVERVVWCTPLQVAENLRGTFPTIRCVAEAMDQSIR